MPIGLHLADRAMVDGEIKLTPSNVPPFATTDWIRATARALPVSIRGADFGATPRCVRAGCLCLEPLAATMKSMGHTHDITVRAILSTSPCLGGCGLAQRSAPLSLIGSVLVWPGGDQDRPWTPPAP
jgi:hypothetical protein